MSTVSEYAKKKDKMLSYLGGKCVTCGAVDKLHIDHIDHLSKSFDISSCWGYKWEFLKTELDKCQILCKDCHLAKTKKEGSLNKSWTTKPRLVHGTVWTYKKHKCRCDLCRQARVNETIKERLRVQGMV